MQFDFLALLVVCCIWIGCYPSLACERKWSISTYNSILARTLKFPNSFLSNKSFHIAPGTVKEEGHYSWPLAVFVMLYMHPLPTWPTHHPSHIPEKFLSRSIQEHCHGSSPMHLCCCLLRFSFGIVEGWINLHIHSSEIVPHGGRSLWNTPQQPASW